jgi:hypothetical protein
MSRAFSEQETYRVLCFYWRFRHEVIFNYDKRLFSVFLKLRIRFLIVKNLLVVKKSRFSVFLKLRIRFLIVKNLLVVKKSRFSVFLIVNNLLLLFLSCENFVLIVNNV